MKAYYERLLKEMEGLAISHQKALDSGNIEDARYYGKLYDDAERKAKELERAYNLGE